ncbi:hypothetical protein FB45DRAFT_868293 [Roridomyces roridus]|uniref:Uncharacterized protein n=1 Tax=Roridomyces roridus TaxID=1738132 RepID=A0AAD7FMA9_9AGAR|nr:hypothetical protein FB45DRAFT_868293 [Roridomyces roridus]
MDALWPYPNVNNGWPAASFDLACSSARLIGQMGRAQLKNGWSRTMAQPHALIGAIFSIFLHPPNIFHAKILNDATGTRSYYEYDADNAPAAPETSLDPKYLDAISSQITALEISRTISRPASVASNRPISDVDAAFSSSSRPHRDVSSMISNTCRYHIDAATSPSSLYLPISIIVQYAGRDLSAAHEMASLATRLEGHISPQVGVHSYRAILRSHALDLFRGYWNSCHVARAFEPRSPYEPGPYQGVNLAAFLGALFPAGIVTGSDIHASLRLLDDVAPIHASSPSLMSLMSTAYYNLVSAAGPGMCVGEWKEETDELVKKWRGPWRQAAGGNEQTLVSDLLKLLEHWNTI